MSASRRCVSLAARAVKSSRVAASIVGSDERLEQRPEPGERRAQLVRHVRDELGAQLLVVDDVRGVEQEQQRLPPAVDGRRAPRGPVGAPAVDEQAHVELAGRQVGQGRLDLAGQRVLAERLQHAHPRLEEREALAARAGWPRRAVPRRRAAAPPAARVAELRRRCSASPARAAAAAARASRSSAAARARRRAQPRRRRPRQRADDESRSGRGSRAQCRTGRPRSPGLRRFGDSAGRDCRSARVSRRPRTARRRRGPARRARSRLAPPSSRPCRRRTRRSRRRSRRASATSGSSAPTARWCTWSARRRSPRVTLAPVLAGGSLRTRGSLTGAVAARAHLGAVAGINGDFFTPSTNDPSGIADDRRRAAPRAGGQPLQPGVAARRRDRRAHARAAGPRAGRRPGERRALAAAHVRRHQPPRRSAGAR